MYEALGWVHAKQGDPARATNELQQAVMRAPTRPGALYHLGQAREAMGQLDSAEAAYAQGFVAERTGSSRRNDEALKRLADARGAPERYLRVVSRFQQDDRARRYDEMLRERLDPGLPFAPFRFANLDGGTFDSRSAVGKVMVVNFWGTWCGPCRREMPDLERLFQRFRSDTAVVIVTVDKDEDPQLARDYVRKEGLTLPVLVDDGYAAAQGLHGAPHTWVIDRNGGIAFTGSGVGGLEFEELSWRVELLKRDKLGTAKRPPDARTTPASRSSR
jgi:thiol-disulfide isomerase/thioredoxin